MVKTNTGQVTVDAGREKSVKYVFIEEDNKRKEIISQPSLK